MPRNRQGVKVLFVEVPAEIWQRFRALAKFHRRSQTAEAILALEEYLTKHETAESRAMALDLEDSRGKRTTAKAPARPQSAR